MKYYPNCLITGAAFSTGTQWAWGDLHETEDAFIFNACLNSKGEADWQYGVIFDTATKTLHCAHQQYYENRGTLVVDKSTNVYLNEAARRYLDNAR